MLCSIIKNKCIFLQAVMSCSAPTDRELRLCSWIWTFKLSFKMKFFLPGSDVSEEITWLLSPQAGLELPFIIIQTVGPADSPWTVTFVRCSRTPSASTCWNTSAMEPESLSRCLLLSRVTGCLPGKRFYTLQCWKVTFYQHSVHEVTCRSG